MAALHVTRDVSSGVVTFRVEGIFDGKAARELQQRIAETRAAEMVIDFSHTRAFLDVTVPMVIRAIGKRRCRLKGLGGHQERLFQYMGMPPHGGSGRSESLGATG